MIIAGYVAIFFGLLWLLFPKTLRWWLVGRASWFLYWLFLGYLYVPAAGLLAPYGWKGWLALAIGLIVLGALLRKIISQLAARAPLVAFRVIGALNLAGGAYLVFFKAS